MANNESVILYQALVACGDDYAKRVSPHTKLAAFSGVPGTGLYEFIDTQPVTVICDLMAQKLNELGYRVTKPLEK